MSTDVRATAWAALHDPRTAASELAAIASTHPEFATTIAGHANAYPELIEWAHAVAPQAGAPVAVTPDPADVLSGRRFLGRRLWLFVLILATGAPLLVEIFATVERVLGGDGSLVGGVFYDNPWGIPFLTIVMAVYVVQSVGAITAAALAAPTTGRRVGAIVLAVGAVGLTAVIQFAAPWWFSGGGLATPLLTLTSTLAAVLLFLSWAVSRPLRGAGYAAVVVVAIAPGLLDVLLWPLVLWQWGWNSYAEWAWRELATVTISAAVLPWAGVLLARSWSRGSERRGLARPAPVAFATSGQPAIAVHTNTLAIFSLVFAFVFAPIGVVFGHVALGQIGRSGEEGRGIAIAGLILSYLAVVTWVVAILAYAGLMGWVLSQY